MNATDNRTQEHPARAPFAVAASAPRRQEGRTITARATTRPRAAQMDAPEIVGESPAAAALLSFIELAAGVEWNALLTGETGTGKTIAARAIHNQSPRADRPFVKVDCSTIPKDLFESTLFGHLRGSFTGATSDKKGRFELADGGTLFLDEIGALGADCQTKLLTAIEEKRFTPVGANAPVEVDVRVIAATSANLEAMMAEGTFKRDLYYRLRGLHHVIAPLRERPEDIPALAHHMAARAAASLGVARPSFDEAALAVLAAHAWEGNIRDLENAVGAMVLKAVRLDGSDVITSERAAAELPGATSRCASDAARIPSGTLRFNPETDTLRDIEERSALAVIEAVLEREGDMKAAAVVLKTDRGNLYRKIKALRERHALGVAPSVVFSV